ncbi:MAG: hypothetical protein KatS3mg105_2927 [Gemmatales bacterium]|nr:MAG: hypothetical protein KatS3mg105_2927 [Gemmatales bacterium]
MVFLHHARLAWLPLAKAALVLTCLSPAFGQEEESIRRQVLAELQPYQGPSVQGVVRTTLTGKVMAGYQGWFTAKGDGSQKGWFHYEWKREFRPGRCSIDLWPDVSDLDEEERYPTPFRHKDGRVACVFSSHQRKTVLRHFEWMREYGIDGVFVQRFVVQTIRPQDLHHCNVVLQHCREGANRYGRTYAVMYDLTGVGRDGLDQVIKDWKLLVDRMKIGKDRQDRAYLHHKGRPVVAIWGVGFNDGRLYSLTDCERLIDFFKDDKTYGQCTVMLGVPAYWRTLDRDAVNDKRLHRLIRQADILSPWSVGRYTSLDGVERFAQDRWRKDASWCRHGGIDYLPVVFPGFSWHNMHPDRPSGEIPRLKGRFLWKQFVEAKKVGARMVYVAMFDEMDEGTAIFKCTNDPPTGKSKFVTFEGLPTDHYLWLTGQGGKLIRGEIPPVASPPRRTR